MKIVVLLFFLSISAFTVAQSDVHKKAVDIFKKDFNDNNFEHIYQTFAPNMKARRTKQHYFDFLTKVKKDHGNALFLELTEYLEFPNKMTRGYFHGTFERGYLMVRLSTDANGQIVGLLIKKQVVF